MAVTGFRWFGALRQHCSCYYHRNNGCHRWWCSWRDAFYNHNGFPLNTTPVADNLFENFPSRQYWCTPCRIYIQSCMSYLSSGNDPKKTEIHKNSNLEPALKDELKNCFRSSLLPSTETKPFGLEFTEITIYLIPFSDLNLFQRWWYNKTKTQLSTSHRFQ